MGGLGSGGHYHWWRNTKTVVEDCLHLDANRWTREGILQAGIHRLGSWQWVYRNGKECSISYEVRTTDLAQPTLRLSYTCRSQMKDQRESVDYPIRLTTTRPRFGGLRWWFVCPLIVNRWPCGRRVGKLFLPPHGRYFGCRRCHNLTYTSCQESHKYDRLYRLVARDMGVNFATAKSVLQELHHRYL